MSAESRDEAIIQNLKDAGCDSETIECFLKDLHSGKAAQGIKALAAHRKKLLEQLHREQRRIDCLDYLLYNIKQNKK